MSEQRFSKVKRKPSFEDIISIEDIILEYVLENGWKDYKRFARVLTSEIAEKRPTDINTLTKLIRNIRHPFFSFNKITRDHFIDRFPLGQLLKQSGTPRHVRRIVSRRRPISQKLRVLVLERDQFRCRMCGKTPKETKLEVDHIIPAAKGGKDSLDNLQTLCIDCNRGKTDLVLVSPPG